ncbi:hypothetical protein Tco_1325290 [Tanacetum coccineum]
MKQQAYNKDQDQDKDSRTQRQSNLHKSKEAGFKDLASEEIVSLKILSRTWNLGLSSLYDYGVDLCVLGESGLDLDVLGEIWV